MLLFQTKSAVTRLTTEMHMQVVVSGTSIAAEFILHTLATIFYDMHQVGLAKKGKRAEQVAAINGVEQLLQISQ